MKRNVFLIGLVCLLVVGLVYAQDATLSVCRYPDGMYQFGFDGIVDGWGFRHYLTYDLVKLTATGDGVEFFTWRYGNTQSIFGYPDAPPCPDTSDEWQPGAPSILIPAPSANWFYIEIMDAYGHWSLVTDSAHPDGIVLFPRDGFVELIGSVGQDVDPDHYRLIEAAS